MQGTDARPYYDSEEDAWFSPSELAAARIVGWAGTREGQRHTRVDPAGFPTGQRHPGDLSYEEERNSCVENLSSGESTVEEADSEEDD